MATFRRVDEVEIDNDDVVEWVRENQTIDEVFSKEEIKAYASEEFEVEDLFDREVLVQWAKDNLQ